MTSFSDRVLAWFDEHGRKDLPWQQLPRDPYRVWLSEVMLQQTQVSTVIPYFLAFVQRFKDVSALASAPLDDVLALWAGMGYYARARNLHRCAQQVCEQYGGEFPADLDALEALPGIGRSTAGAILAQAFDQRGVILDGNVKRVLARHAAVEGWPGQSAVQHQLWSIAELRTPHKRHADYVQGMMDLGAMLCTRSTPACDWCPIAEDCSALQLGNPLHYPGKRPKKKLPTQSVYMLLCHSQQGDVLLEKRPPTGIWGGLWSLPEIKDLQDCAAYVQHQYGYKIAHMEEQVSFVHIFSHYRLQITPVTISLEPAEEESIESAGRWFDQVALGQLGMPKPVASLVNNFLEQQAQ